MKKKIDLKVSSSSSVGNIKYEKIFCIVIGIIVLLLFVLSFNDYIFIPACLFMGCLELFAIGYLFRNDLEKKKLVYLLFILGVLLLIIAVIYTFMRTI